MGGHLQIILFNVTVTWYYRYNPAPLFTMLPIERLKSQVIFKNNKFLLGPSETQEFYLRFTVLSLRIKIKSKNAYKLMPISGIVPTDRHSGADVHKYLHIYRLAVMYCS